MGDNKNSIDKKSFAGKGVFPHKFAFTLLIPIRNIFLSPERLIERLELKEDFLVLEIGPDFLIPVGDSNGEQNFLLTLDCLAALKLIS